jgi:DNA-binding transcriptional MerR regulator
MPGYQLMLHPAAGQRLTLEALAAEVGLHPDLVERFVAHGLLPPVPGEPGALRFDVKEVRRLRTVCRLRDHLGINLPGIAVILDLLERIEALQRELANLRRG